MKLHPGETQRLINLFIGPVSILTMFIVIDQMYQKLFMFSKKKLYCFENGKKLTRVYEKLAALFNSSL